MAEIPKIVLPHGGYKKLIVYRKSDVVYEGTVTFCRRFLPACGDRLVAGSARRRRRRAPAEGRTGGLEHPPKERLGMNGDGFKGQSMRNAIAMQA